MPDRPNVVVVVLDCGRHYDFPGGPGPVRMPFVESLRSEVVEFPRAVSPSPWTVPGHASLFTGQYPWEHRVHMKGQLFLDPSTPTIASRLRDLGYASLALTANGLVSPSFGLLNGFDEAVVGEWWEKFLRVSPTGSVLPAPPGVMPARPSSGSGPEARGRSGPSAVPSRLAHSLVEGQDPVWMGSAVNVLNLGLHRLRQSGLPYPLPISPWIEPTMEQWVAALSPERPIFCFVNFLETHEPYIADPARRGGALGWARHALLRQDKTGFLAGRWNPSPSQFGRLRTLYRDALGALDRRIVMLVDILRRAQRWENTLFVLTADHGQAFGEHGYLFHATRVWEPLLRVPLWVRWPLGRGGGRQATGWASLIDVLPTVLEACGASEGLRGSGLPLTQLVGAARPGPALAMSDGLQGKQNLAQLAPDRVALWDTPWIAGYADDRKLLLDLERDELQVYEVMRDPKELRDRWPEEKNTLSDLGQQVRDAGHALTGRAPAPVTADIASRLKSWGYD